MVHLISLLCVCTIVRAFKNVSKRMCLHLRVCTDAHMRVRVHAHTGMYECVCVHICVYRHASVYACVLRGVKSPHS